VTGWAMVMIVVANTAAMAVIMKKGVFIITNLDYNIDITLFCFFVVFSGLTT
jgi:hypothetical protein